MGLGDTIQPIHLPFKFAPSVSISSLSLRIFYRDIFCPFIANTFVCFIIYFIKVQLIYNAVNFC